ncbi:MAG: hypothetical protein JKY95_06495 [Planctomycetaceae bacterium]|nr:hypothetical protein [Planctomycetaceae bacterium]
MNRYRINQRNNAKRRGSLLPAIAIALLAVGSAAGLVLNRLWIDAAEVELHNAAQASALAAAGEFLGDHLLVSEVDYDLIVAQAKQRAVLVALANRVAGSPVELNLEDDSDVYFGYKHFDSESGDSVFLESNSQAKAVVVRAQRSQKLGNPLRLFLAGVTKRSTADVLVYSEVSFDNLIDHFRPIRSLHIPALPMGILASDENGNRTDTWHIQITQKQGADNFRFDEQTHEVVAGSDGIIEMVLHSVPLNTDPLFSNVQLLDFNNDLGDQQLSKQILNGLNQADLESLDGVMPAQKTFSIAGTSNITTPLQLSLESQIGQQRLCLLYTKQEPITIPGWSTLQCQGVVAIRIMKVIPESGESATIIVQPTVLVTKTAALARYTARDRSGQYNTSINPADLFSENPFVYKMFVSR